MAAEIWLALGGTSTSAVGYSQAYVPAKAVQVGGDGGRINN